MSLQWRRCRDGQGNPTIWWEVTLRGNVVSLRLAASEQGEWTIGLFGVGILGSAAVARGSVDGLADAQDAAAEFARGVVYGLAEQLREDEDER